MRRRQRDQDISPLGSDLEFDDMDEMRAQMMAMQNELLQLRAGAAAQPAPYAGPSATDLARELQKVGKLDCFDGTPEKWPEWDFTFMGYMNGMSEELTRLIGVSRNAREPVGNPHDELGRQLSARLYQMLTMLLKKRAHKSLRAVPVGHGIEAFRQLNQRFGMGFDDQGTTGMLNRVINFKFGETISDVLDQLAAFNVLIAEHDSAPDNEPIQDSILRTVLIHNVPEPLLSHLTLNSDRYRTSADVKKNIEQYCRSRRTGDASEPTPMEVDAVWGKAGKKGKSKSKKGNSKSKGDKKGSKSDKSGKSGKKGAQSSGKSNFEGYCKNENCGMWGHMWKDCRKKGGGACVSATDNGSNAVEPGKETPAPKKPGETAAIEIDRDDEFWDSVEQDDHWILMVEGSEDSDQASDPDRDSDDIEVFASDIRFGPYLDICSMERMVMESLVVDSGTFAHVCYPSFLPQFPIRAGSDPRGAISASYTALTFYGTKLVPGWFVTSDGKWLAAHIEFRVYDVKRALLSSMRMAKISDIETRLRQDNMRLVFHRSDEQVVYIYEKNELPFVDFYISDKYHSAAVQICLVEDDGEVLDEKRHLIPVRVFINGIS